MYLRDVDLPAVHEVDELLDVRELDILEDEDGAALGVLLEHPLEVGGARGEHDLGGDRGIVGIDLGYRN